MPATANDFIGGACRPNEFDQLRWRIAEHLTADEMSHWLLPAQQPPYQNSYADCQRAKDGGRKRGAGASASATLHFRGDGVAFFPVL